MEKTRLRTVVLDTNAINNDNPDGELIRSHEVLNKIEESIFFNLAIPKIVLEEIFEHKRKCFRDEQNKLARNKLISRLATEDRIKGLKFDATLEEYIAKEKTNFSILEIQNASWAMNKLRKLALLNRPPFDKNSDKGFKDGIIAMTVEEFLNAKPDESVILVSEDGRLGEYFEKNDRVSIVKTLDELDDVYGAEMDATSHGAKPKNAASNIYMNRITKARELLTQLRNSPHFADTHSIIARLRQYEADLTDSDRADIIKSATENSQINWIIGDPDVSEFVLPIFEKIKKKLSIEEYNAFIRNAGLQNKYPIVTKMSDIEDALF